MLPFSLPLRPGSSVHEQVVRGVERAVVEGLLKPGDGFPSVRVLSRELRINPNTAHRIVGTLVDEGVLVVYPGIGTRVADDPVCRDPRAKARLLGEELARVALEGRRLGLELSEVRAAFEEHWRALGSVEEEEK